jgi:hypothetical protein
MPGYDADLVERLRERLAGEHGVSERAMFGGVAFMLDGNMCVGAMKGGDLMVRVAAADEEQALAEPHTRRMDMTGRPMAGWILVEPPGFAADRDLAAWVQRAVVHVRTLPPKRK